MNRNEIIRQTKERLECVHVGCFEGRKEPLLLISTAYPGIWLEHVYDSVFYAENDRSKLYLAKNTVELFIDNQKENGQYPCFVLDPARSKNFGMPTVGYSQIQECVSFASLCLKVYEMDQSREFLEKIYNSCAKWANWLEKYRMTLKTGLVEMFVGYDTGHDNSGRLEGLSCRGNYFAHGRYMDADVLPPDDPVAPVLAVDMNCNYFATLTSLSKMAHILDLEADAQKWLEKSKNVKKKLFELCFDEKDCFFYDVSKNGDKRKYLSSTIFHLFMEGVLDPTEDEKLISELYIRHISNKNEFATPYPYPSMAICDPSCKHHVGRNCWGYFSQGLIALRCTLWMEKYGFEKEFKNLLEKWAQAWTDCFDTMKMGQELDPITGAPSPSSQWYSSTMLLYLYATGNL